MVTNVSGVFSSIPKFFFAPFTNTSKTASLVQQSLQEISHSVNSGRTLKGVQEIHQPNLFTVNRGSGGVISTIGINQQALGHYQRVNFLRSILRKKNYVLSSPAFQTRRHYSSGDKNGGGGNAIHWSTIIHNLGTGLGAILAGLAGYSFSNAKTKEVKVQEEKVMQGEGLINITPLYDRTYEQQAKLYEVAQTQLTIVGISGLRMVEKEVNGKSNPIREALESRMQQGVKVRLLIYNPKKKTELNLKDEDVRKINQTISLSREVRQKYPNCFEIKMVDQIQSYHGDIIDNFKAHVVPIIPTGIRSLKSPMIETYVRKEGLEFNKFILIKDLFDSAWDHSEKVC